jgi:hypothetical protein
MSAATERAGDPGALSVRAADGRPVDDAERLFARPGVRADERRPVARDCISDNASTSVRIAARSTVWRISVSIYAPFFAVRSGALQHALLHSTKWGFLCLRIVSQGRLHFVQNVVAVVSWFICVPFTGCKDGERCTDEAERAPTGPNQLAASARNRSSRDRSSHASTSAVRPST